ncbi:hypothetical protein B7486_49675 [cyanobacterium TDX16]|nr:hypothetical protein B7486_49675 [cyanobacterium TDX16]
MTAATIRLKSLGRAPQRENQGRASMVMNRLYLSPWEDELSEHNGRRTRTSLARSTLRQRLMRKISLTAGSIPHREQKQSQVVVMQLQSFEQVIQAVQILWQGQALVLNLTQLDAKPAQRAIDFVAGATCSLEGQQQYLAPRVFLFVPKSVELANAIVDTAEL